MALQALVKNGIIMYNTGQQTQTAREIAFEKVCLAKSTINPLHKPREAAAVAKGLASRLRLKRRFRTSIPMLPRGRQGAGISPEIETSIKQSALLGARRRQGAGISPEIETRIRSIWLARN